MSRTDPNRYVVGYLPKFAPSEKWLELTGLFNATPDPLSGSVKRVPPAPSKEIAPDCITIATAGTRGIGLGIDGVEEHTQDRGRGHRVQTLFLGPTSRSWNGPAIVLR